MSGPARSTVARPPSYPGPDSCQRQDQALDAAASSAIESGCAHPRPAIGSAPDPWSDAASAWRGATAALRLSPLAESVRRGKQLTVPELRVSLSVIPEEMSVCPPSGVREHHPIQMMSGRSAPGTGWAARRLARDRLLLCAGWVPQRPSSVSADVRPVESGSELFERSVRRWASLTSWSRVRVC